MGMKERLEQKAITKQQITQNATAENLKRENEKASQQNIRRTNAENRYNQEIARLLRFADSTPLPAMLNETAMSLSGKISQPSTDVRLIHSENSAYDQWTENDMVNITSGTKVTYEISWEYNQEGTAYNSFKAGVCTNGDIEIEYQREDGFKKELLGESKTIKLSKSKWEHNHELIETSLMTAIDHPFHPHFSSEPSPF